eukprot:4878905-Pleurochrysis_carterae.AAC.1
MVVGQELKVEAEMVAEKEAAEMAEATPLKVGSAEAGHAELEEGTKVVAATGATALLETAGEVVEVRAGATAAAVKALEMVVAAMVAAVMAAAAEAVADQEEHEAETTAA